MRYSALRRILARIANLLLPGRADRALARKLRSHLAFLEDEYRRRGLSAEEARRSAAHALGGMEQTKELHRDARSFGWVGSVPRDVTYAVRAFRRRPLVALASILSIGLGIGLNTAVFSVVDWCCCARFRMHRSTSSYVSSPQAQLQRPRRPR
jgi:hypothetical protein